MLDEGRHINFGGGRGITEQEAVSVFREFTVDGVATVINPSFANKQLLEQAAQSLRIPLADLNQMTKDNPNFKILHSTAGRLMYEETLYGAMVDIRHQGANNIFEPESNPDKMPETQSRYRPQVTQRGICTGAPLVLTTLQAIGQVIQKNKAVITDVLSSRVDTNTGC